MNDTKKTGPRGPHANGLCALLRELSKGERGFATAELVNDDIAIRQVTNSATLLRTNGELFKAKIAYNEYRWFDTEARAKAYEVAHQQRDKFAPPRKARNVEPWQPPKMGSAPVSIANRSRAWWPKDAPVNAGQVKVTRLPGYTGDRWGVSGKIVGDFGSLGIGRYLEAA